jgi:hypothetical protein
MAVDTSNNVRVDLQEIFNNCEEQTAKTSRRIGENALSQSIVITEDDYSLIWAWANEAMVLIADSCNYITNATQTGLNAISENFYPSDPDADPPVEGNPNPFDEKDHLDLTQSQKQTGEFLSKKPMDTLEINVTQMSGMEPLDYNLTQTQIRAAIIEYILFKWYLLMGLPNEMSIRSNQFDFWKNKLMTNSINNQKTIKVRKPYRLF